MCRKLSLIVAVILLASSGALAQIGQVEGFGINTGNNVVRDGLGLAVGGNRVGIAHGQFEFDPGTFTLGAQGEGARIGQAAVAFGLVGASGVNQNAVVDGLQGQAAGLGGVVQAQALEVGLNQAVFNVGIGGAAGAQNAFTAQGQLVASPGGLAAQAQFITAAQFGAVVGGPGSNINVTQNIQGAVFQNQATP
jgi:hypothetical protein